MLNKMKAPLIMEKRGLKQGF